MRRKLEKSFWFYYSTKKWYIESFKKKLYLQNILVCAFPIFFLGCLCFTETVIWFVTLLGWWSHGWYPGDPSSAPTHIISQLHFFSSPSASSYLIFLWSWHHMAFLLITLSWHSSWITETIRKRFAAMFITFSKYFLMPRKLLDLGGEVGPESRTVPFLEYINIFSLIEVPECSTSDGKSLNEMVKFNSCSH